MWRQPIGSGRGALLGLLIVACAMMPTIHGVMSFRMPSQGHRKDGTTVDSIGVEKISIPSPKSIRRPFSRRKPAKIRVENLEDLREAVLDEGRKLRHVQLSNQFKAAMQQPIESREYLDHDVLKLIKDRFDAGTTPGYRTDNATLALAIEGGGMRGCVSAGMAAAIESLGLTDTFDVIYGSSAGSVIGSYLVSRQICLDVYLDLLPAAKRSFVCIRRMLSSISGSALKVATKWLPLKLNWPEKMLSNPGMNISFILDGIMDDEHGIRPLDMERFRQNNARQPLRVVSSCVGPNGEFLSKSFGTEDFFGEGAAVRAGGERSGLFACLEASMTVPGATGPPVPLALGSQNQTATACFDAFCFEPIPYRSAVEEGASHVLALCSRPLGFQPKTKPGIYEKAIAPLYFWSHGHKATASFFARSGQQFLYAEDLLTLKDAKASMKPISVPSPKVFYGASKRVDHKEIQNRHKQWKKAHLFPIQVPPETPELGTLEQDRDAVLQAVRAGYSIAFDMLAPIVGLEPDRWGVSGKDVAEMLFPATVGSHEDETKEVDDSTLLGTKVRVPGKAIPKRVPRIAKRKNLGARRRRVHVQKMFLDLPGIQQAKAPGASVKQ